MIKKAIEYLKDRLDERSTWMLMIAGITGASVLDPPWSYVAAVLGIIASLTPDSDKGKPDDFHNHDIH